MRFFQTVISGAALIAAALALELNDVPTSIEPGKTYTITYSPKDNTPTTLVLRKGDSKNLDTIATLTTSATGGSFQWSVDSALPNGNDYAIEIKQANVDPNYSGLIKLTGSSAQASSSGSATPSASTASAESSAASSKASATAVTTTLATATSVSAGASSTPGSNSTIVSATLSRTATGSSSPGSTASTTGSSPPNSTGAASMLGSSPVALIFGAVAALAYF